jgi:hypothetical protein
MVCRGEPNRLDVEAQERVPTYFLRIFGIDGITIRARAPQRGAVQHIVVAGALLARREQ